MPGGPLSAQLTGPAELIGTGTSSGAALVTGAARPLTTGTSINGAVALRKAVAA
jgi:hypothetical protein